MYQSMGLIDLSSCLPRPLSIQSSAETYQNGVTTEGTSTKDETARARKEKTDLENNISFSRDPPPPPPPPHVSPSPLALLLHSPLSPLALSIFLPGSNLSQETDSEAV